MVHEVEPKEGGYVFVTSRHNRTLERITKVTKTQIVTSQGRYRLNDGWAVGGDKWSITQAVAISDEKADQIREEFRIARETREMQGCITEAVKTLDHATLKRIVEILDSKGGDNV